MSSTFVPPSVPPDAHFTQTARLIADIARHGTEGIYNRLAPRAGAYLKLLLYTSAITLTAILALAVLKALTGYKFLDYLLLPAIILSTLTLGLIWSPLSMLVGLLLGETHSPKIVGEKYVRTVAALLFIESITVMYLIKVPLHRNPEIVPVFFVAVMVVILGNVLYGGFFSGRFYTFTAALMIVYITINSFMPEITAWWQEFQGDIREVNGVKVKVLDRFRIQLPAGNQLSEKVAIPQGVNPILDKTGYLEVVLDDGRVMEWPMGQEKLRIPRDGYTGQMEFRLRGTPGWVTITLTEIPRSDPVNMVYETENIPGGYRTMEDFVNGERFLERLENEGRLLEELWASARSESDRDSIAAYNYTLYRTLVGLKKLELSPRNMARLETAIRTNIKRAARFR